jgi:hypothetical protein
MFSTLEDCAPALRDILMGYILIYIYIHINEYIRRIGVWPAQERNRKSYTCLYIFIYMYIYNIYIYIHIYIYIYIYTNKSLASLEAEQNTLYVI